TINKLIIKYYEQSRQDNRGGIERAGFLRVVSTRGARCHDGRLRSPRRNVRSVHQRSDAGDGHSIDPQRVGRLGRRRTRIMEHIKNEDWAKEVQLQDMGADRMMNPPRKPLHAIRDNYQGEELDAIERENVGASNQSI